MAKVIAVEGLDEALALLDKYRDPELKKLLTKATKAGATSLKGPIKAAAPVDDGDLRSSVSARKSKRTPQAYIVGPKARHAHLVIGGTKPHTIRPRHIGGFLLFGGRWTKTVHHPGTDPNSFVERAADSGRREAEDRILVVLREPLKGR